VGFSTIIECDSIRTSVTAIFPRGLKNVFRRMPWFANWFSLNGDGAMTGVHYLIVWFSYSTNFNYKYK
ncbi:unnamed protein product, partial [Rotaria sp. Silwood1]